MKSTLSLLSLAFCWLLLNLSLTSVKAQMKVGQPTGSPDPSAALDVSGGPYANGSQYRGIAPPKVALTQTSLASPVTSPALGLLVYNTAKTGDVTPGYYYWDGARWSRFNTSNASSARVAAVSGQYIPAYLISQVTNLTAPPDIIYIADEGREGMFRYVSGSTAVVDGAMSLSVTAGRYIRIVEGVGINVKWFGAKGDDATNDQQAIQAAINYGKTLGNSSIYVKKTIYFPSGRYRVNSTLDATGTPGLTIRGEGGRYFNSTIVGNTGGLILDFSGSTSSGLEDISLASQNELPKPSTIGVQFALTKVGGNGTDKDDDKGGLNCQMHNVTIMLASLPGTNSVNGGLGTVGVMNCRSEEFSAREVQIRANTGMVFTNQRGLSSSTGYNFTVSSSFDSLQTNKIVNNVSVPGSMGVVDISGSIQTWDKVNPALLLNGTNKIVFSGYIGRAGVTSGRSDSYETAIRCTSINLGLNVKATIESYSQTIFIDEQLENSDIEVTMANQTDASRPSFELKNGAKILGTRIKGAYGNGNVEMNTGRYFLFTSDINSGDNPTSAYVANSEFICNTWSNNKLFVKANLLKQSTNCKFSTGEPFEKEGPFIQSVSNINKYIGGVKSGNTPVEVDLIHFNKADKTTASSDGGYYQAIIKGNIRLGAYTTYNGPCSVYFESYATLIRNSDGTYAVTTPASSKTTLLSKSAINPSYLDITGISLAINTSGNDGILKLTINTSGSGATEAIYFSGNISLLSDFPVNQSVLFTP